MVVVQDVQWLPQYHGEKNYWIISMNKKIHNVEINIQHH